MKRRFYRLVRARVTPADYGYSPIYRWKWLHTSRRLAGVIGIALLVATASLAAEITLGPRLPNETDDSPRLNRLYQTAAAGDTLVVPSGEYVKRGPVFWKGDKPVNVRAWGAHFRVPDDVIGMPVIFYGGSDGKAWFDTEFIGPHITGNNRGAGMLLQNLARARIRTGLIRACTDAIVMRANGGVGMNSLYLDFHCISGCKTALRVECDATSCINHVRFAHFQVQTWDDQADMIFSLPDGVQCSGWTFDDVRFEARGMQPNIGRFVGGPFVFKQGYWIEGDTGATWRMKVLPGTLVRFEGHHFNRDYHGGGVVE